MLKTFDPSSDDVLPSWWDQVLRCPLFNISFIDWPNELENWPNLAA